MVEKLAIAAVLVFFAGIVLSVLIGECLRKRDAREAEQRAAARRQRARAAHHADQVQRPPELSPSAAAELALRSSLARSSSRRT
ncbi:MAG: hypothetical protein GX575_18180 [Candidatus Anammoximicrobium sp.]|nr:hypothetical protein [Candidatus Anammoximicrobium sp.]